MSNSNCNDTGDYIQLQIELPETHFILYKDQEYPINFDSLKYSSKYFYDHRQDILEYKYIDISKYDPERNILTLSTQAVQTFIQYIQRKSIQLTNENISTLHYLSHKYDIKQLKASTENYINDHQKEVCLKILLQHELDGIIDKDFYENIISKNLSDYLKDEDLLKLDIIALYRILSKESKINQNIQISAEKNEFLMKTLRKYGRNASILFKYANFTDFKDESLHLLLTEYSNIFDFSFINSALLKMFLEMKKTVNDEHLKYTQEIDTLKNKFLHDLQEKDNEINNLKNIIDKEGHETKIKYEQIVNELKEKENKINELNKNIELIKKDFEKKLESIQNENEKLKQEKKDIIEKWECIKIPNENDLFIGQIDVYQYFKQMADAGHIPSIYGYALLLESTHDEYTYDDNNDDDNNDDNNDDENALKYYKKAADLGHVSSIYRYAYHLEHGYGKMPINKKEAFKYYKKAVDLGHALSMYRYALLFDNGDDEIPVNKEEACKYYKMGADKNEINSMNNYAWMLEKGEGVTPNVTEALKYYKQAADLGSSSAMFNYATMLISGEYDNIPYEPKVAFQYYQKAADYEPQAMFICGQMLENGEGVQEDMQAALKYYKNAAKFDQLNAIYRYASLLDTGEKGVPVNKEKALKYYKKACDLGDINSMNNYGAMLQKGEGGAKKDIKKACKYYKQSADSGNPEAMHNYGLVLLNGDDPIQVNKPEAYKYFKMAADNGMTDAMDIVIKMLDNGDGIPVNHDEANKYKKIKEEIIESKK